MGFRAEVLSNGFAIATGVLDGKGAAQVLAALMAAPVRRSRAGARHILSHLAVAAVASHEPVLSLAREALGKEAFPFRATLFEKSTIANWLVAWHQDTALPLEERRDVEGWGPWSTKENVNYAHAPAVALEQVLALRLHLDDSTAENGPLRVLPRTHELGVLTDERMHDLAARAEAVECLVGKGGAVAMRPLLVHASSKSRAELHRRVLHIEYAAHAEIAAPLRLACGYAEKFQPQRLTD